MATTEVACGWVIIDQAAAIPGMSFGPGYLKGRQRSGPLLARAHNLIGKDVIFRGAGKHALLEIVKQMSVMDSHLIRCGIREGMVIPKFVPSEYGGGDDQITVEATEDDIARSPYYLYVFPEEVSAYSFSSLITAFGAQLTGFVPGAGWGGKAREIIEGLGTLFSKASALSKSKTDLERALKADKVVVLLTGDCEKKTSRIPISKHSHTHRISTLAGDIIDAVEKV